VVVDDRAGEWLHGACELLGRHLTGSPHAVARPALGEPGRLPGEHHRRPGLAHEVEDPVDQPLPRDAAI
jgi:hypothetical protein